MIVPSHKNRRLSSPPEEPPRTRTHGHRIAQALALVTLAIILGATLYPFDFTTDGYQDRLDAALAQKLTITRGLADDVFTNILLFLPFGFVIAHLTRQRFPFVKAMGLAFLAGTLLSSSVEFLQLYLPFRYTSFIDVYSNAAGTLVGFLLHALLGKKISHHIADAVTQPNNRKALGWLTAAYVTFAASALLLTIPLLLSLRLSEWGKGYPLTVGNVHTGDKPWSGTVQRMMFAKLAVLEPDVDRTLKEQRLIVPEKDFLLCDYDFRRKNFADDQFHRLPSLVGRGSDVVMNENGVQISGNSWMETNGPAQNISDELSVTTQFSVLIRLKTQNTTQGGPARIISIDKNPYEVNLSLTQSQDQLCVRFRSMTTGMAAYSPGFFVPGVFADTAMHTLLVTSNGLVLRVFVDDESRNYSTVLGPGLSLFNRFLPTHKLLNIASPVSWANELLFALCMFLPLSYFLAFIVIGLRHRPLAAAVVSLAGIAAPVIAFDRLVAYMTNYGLPHSYILLITAVMTAGFAATVLMRIMRPNHEISFAKSFHPPEPTFHEPIEAE